MPGDVRRERKVVTVLFCDLVGFTSRAEEMDPEDVAALLGPYHARLKEEFERKLAEDRDFAASPEARLGFFYRRSPWWDSRMGLYPVGRLAALEGVPLEPER